MLWNYIFCVTVVPQNHRCMILVVLLIDKDFIYNMKVV